MCTGEITWERVHISQLQTSLNHYQYARLTKDVEHIILEKVNFVVFLIIGDNMYIAF